MIDNLGFWLWVLLMIFICVVIGGLGGLIWWSERKGLNRPERELGPRADRPRDSTSDR